MIAPADQVLGIRAEGNHLRAQCWNPGFVGVALSQLLEARLRIGGGGGWGGWHKGEISPLARRQSLQTRGAASAFENYV